jgi:hypothetical protein
MHRLDTLPSFDFANERRGDVFTVEFPNRWDAREARHAAELVDGRRRPSLTRRALAAVGHWLAAVAPRVDDAVRGRSRSSGNAAR